MSIEGQNCVIGYVNQHIHYEISMFLMYEVELLDTGAFRDWLDMLSEDLVYQVPIRLTVETGQGTGFIDNVYHIDDDRFSIESRIKRLETDYAWAERPPSRVRHYVTNIRIKPGEEENHYYVKSNFILYRGRFDSNMEILTGERHDVIYKREGNWKLAKRVVLLDQTTLPTHNISFFF